MIIEKVGEIGMWTFQGVVKGFKKRRGGYILNFIEVLIQLNLELC